MKYHKNNQSGFSLVETLVAITILLVVIVGPMTISSSTAKSTSFSSEQVVAFFLAQEGAEIVQKVRDDLILQSFLSDPQVGWDEFIGAGSFTSPLATCFGAAGCRVEINTDATASLKPASACSATACRLYIDSSSVRAQYTHTATGNSITPYTRTVRLILLPGGDDVHVISTVTWSTGNIAETQEVTVETYLYNIYGS